VTTKPIDITALIAEEKIKSKSPYPEIVIGARITTAIPPPMMINIHIANMNTKIDDSLKWKPPS
jgi:hypothetical protein